MFSNVFSAGKEIANKITNKFLNLSEVEAKIKEATNDDKWGPYGSLMKEISDETFSTANFQDVMTFLWYRIFSERPVNSRRTYKGLVLLSYLIVNGSDYVAVSCKAHLGEIGKMRAFSDVYGVADLSIRRKASDIVDLLNDSQKLSDERSRAKTYKTRYYCSDSTSGVNSSDSNVANAQNMGNIDDWHPESKSIPYVIGESFINFVNTFTQNISGPPPTETHDNFDIHPLDNAIVDPVERSDRGSAYVTSFKADRNDSSTDPKVVCKKIDPPVESTPTTKDDNEAPIIDFLEPMADENRASANELTQVFNDNVTITDNDLDAEFNNLRGNDNVAASFCQDIFRPDFDNFTLVPVFKDAKPVATPAVVAQTASATSQVSVPKPEMKVGATWNELDSLNIDLNNLCGRRKHLYTKS